MLELLYDIFQLVPSGASKVDQTLDYVHPFGLKTAEIPRIFAEEVSRLILVVRKHIGHMTLTDAEGLFITVQAKAANIEPTLESGNVIAAKIFATPTDLSALDRRRQQPYLWRLRLQWQCCIGRFFEV